MQEYLKKSSCFFALIFLLFVIAVSLPGIFETGEFLKDHLDAAYWSFRTDRQKKFRLRRSVKMRKELFLPRRK